MWCNYCAHVPRARGLQQEKPTRRSLRTSTKSSPQAPKLEKAHTQPWRPDPAEPKISTNKIFNIFKNWEVFKSINWFYCNKSIISQITLLLKNMFFKINLWEEWHCFTFLFITWLNETQLDSLTCFCIQSATPCCFGGNTWKKSGLRNNWLEKVEPHKSLNGSQGFLVVLWPHLGNCCYLLRINR